MACNQEDEPASDNTDARPNILLIIADDMGVEATPGYSIGDSKPNMPNLESLADNGISFDNVWAYPLCSPTRATILTGRYGYRTGVLNPTNASRIASNEKTIQAFLDENTDNAYTHSIIGKWHLSNNEPERPIQMGIDYYAGILGGGVTDYNSWDLTENGETNAFSGYVTTKLTDLAIAWINQQTKPWFCWMAYNAPHTPFHLPPNNMHSQGNLANDQASIDANPSPYYMAMIESLDFEIGRLMQNIPEDELENTVIIFIGDNGSPGQVIQSPYISNRAKGSLHQGGIHVPMIVSGKGVSRLNDRDDNLISSTDLFCTIAEIAGMDLPQYQDSYSFYDLLSSSGTNNRAYNYAEILDDDDSQSGFAIRNAQYKLIEFDNGQQRFYDLLADPYEGVNLINRTLGATRQAALTALENEADAIRQ